MNDPSHHTVQIPPAYPNLYHRILDRSNLRVQTQSTTFRVVLQPTPNHRTAGITGHNKNHPNTAQRTTNLTNTIINTKEIRPKHPTCKTIEHVEGKKQIDRVKGAIRTTSKLPFKKIKIHPTLIPINKRVDRQSHRTIRHHHNNEI